MFEHIVAVYAQIQVYMCCLNTLVGWVNKLTEGLIMMSFDVSKDVVT